MSIRDTIHTNLGAGADSASLRRVFTPQHMLAHGGGAPRGAILGTFLQDATHPALVKLRDSTLDVFARRGMMDDSARAVPRGEALIGGAAAEWSFRGGRAAPQQAVAASVQVAAPVHGGLLAQHVAQERALLYGLANAPANAVAEVGVVAAAGAPVVAEVAPVVDDAARISAAAVSVVDDAAVHVDDMEKFLIEAFRQLGQADDATRLAVLTAAVDTQAARYGTSTVAELLGRTLAEAPLEQSSASLAEAIQGVSAKATAAAVPAAAASVPGATPAAANVIGETLPVIDDAVRSAPAVLEGTGLVTPVLDDAARAAAAVTRVGGGTRMMSMTSAIVEALRVLPRI